MRRLNLLDNDFAVGHSIRIHTLHMENQLNTLPSLDSPRGTASTVGSTNLEKWIKDPSDFVGVPYTTVNLGELSPEVFGDRLTILYNTFWQSTYGTTALAGNLPASVMQTGWLNITTSTSNIVSFITSDTVMKKKTKPVYKTNWNWFTALLVSSLVLLTAAYAGLLLKYITLAPDIIGYASSLTILNPYVPTPTGGSTLHGLERAALLHDMPVRIGDVCPDEAVGAIAFVRTNNREVARLNRKRLYI